MGIYTQITLKTSIISTLKPTKPLKNSLNHHSYIVKITFILSRNTKPLTYNRLYRLRNTNTLKKLPIGTQKNTQ